MTMRRRLASASLDFGVSAAVAFAAIAFALLIVLISGKSPISAARVFFDGAFGTYTWGSTLRDMIPLVLVALGWCLVFTGGRFHVGFQGQILIGGLFSAVAALNFPGLPAIVLVPLVACFGMIGGGLYAAIVAGLWARLGVNEILSTLLLNLVAIQIIAWTVRGPLQESTHTLPQTDVLPENSFWPLFFHQAVLRWDVVLIVVSVVIVGFLMRATTFGFRLRLVGDSPGAAAYAGVSPTRVAVVAIVASGVLSGVAGASLVLGGSTPGMTDNFDAGYGFEGIAVALLARNSPLGVIPAALLFAALRQGGGVVQAQVGVSSAVVDVMQGLVIVLVILAAALLATFRRSSRATITTRLTAPSGAASSEPVR
jgi:general nucleoside transport system permease protein